MMEGPHLFCVCSVVQTAHGQLGGLTLKGLLDTLPHQAVVSLCHFLLMSSLMHDLVTLSSVVSLLLYDAVFDFIICRMVVSGAPTCRSGAV